MDPVMLLRARLSPRNWVNDDDDDENIHSGIGASSNKGFHPTNKYSNSVNRPNPDGNAPVKKLLLTSKCFKPIKFDNEAGKIPVKPLFCKAKNVTTDSATITVVLGIVPVISLPCKSITSRTG
jgi:hypothetical protein